MSFLSQPVGASDALVLRTWPTGETSVIASLLTARYGFVSVLAKAARQMKSPLRPLVQSGRLLGVEISLNPQRDLQYLRGGRVLLDPLATAATLEKSSFLLSSLEIVDHCRPTAEYQGKLYALCAELVRELSCASPGCEAPLFYAFELTLLELQGVSPALDSCSGCGADLADSPEIGSWFSRVSGGVLCGRCASACAEARALSKPVLTALQQLGTQPTGRLEASELPRDVSREIGIVLHKFLGYHLPGYRLPSALELLRTPEGQSHFTQVREASEENMSS